MICLEEWNYDPLFVIGVEWEIRRSGIERLVPSRVRSSDISTYNTSRKSMGLKTPLP